MHTDVPLVGEPSRQLMTATTTAVSRDRHATAASPGEAPSEAPASRSSYRALALGALLVTLVHGVFLALWCDRLMPPISGWFDYLAQEMSRGKIPYRDFYLWIPPLHLLENYWIQELFGEDLWIKRIPGAIQRIGISLAMLAWISRFCPVSRALPAVITGAFVAETCLYMGPFTYFYDCLFFAIAMGLIASIAIERAPAGSPALIALAGAMGGISALAKHTLGPFASAVICATLVVIVWRRTGWKAAARGALIFSLGWWVPVGATFLWLAQHGAMGAFIEQVFLVGPGAKGTPGQIFFRPVTILMKWVNDVHRGDLIGFLLFGIVAVSFLILIPRPRPRLPLRRGYWAVLFWTASLCLIPNLFWSVTGSLVDDPYPYFLWIPPYTVTVLLPLGLALGSLLRSREVASSAWSFWASLFVMTGLALVLVALGGWKPVAAVMPGLGAAFLWPGLGKFLGRRWQYVPFLAMACCLFLISVRPWWYVTIAYSATIPLSVVAGSLLRSPARRADGRQSWTFAITASALCLFAVVAASRIAPHYRPFPNSDITWYRFKPVALPTLALRVVVWTALLSVPYLLYDFSRTTLRLLREPTRPDLASRFLLTALGLGTCYAASVSMGAPGLEMVGWTAVPLLVLAMLAVRPSIPRRLPQAMVCTLAALVCFGVTCIKVSTPVMWVGWTESPLREPSYTSRQPLLKNLRLNRESVNCMDTIVGLIEANSAPNEKIFCYPLMPIFYYLTGRRTPTFAAINYYDVCPDKYAREDAVRLRESPPAVIVEMVFPKESVKFHEDLYRGSQKSGQKEIEAVMREITSDYRLAATLDGECYRYYDDKHPIRIWVRRRPARGTSAAVPGGAQRLQ